MSRRSSLTSNSDEESVTSSDTSEMSFVETIHIEELFSHLNCDENGNVFHNDLLSVLSARYADRNIIL